MVRKLICSMCLAVASLSIVTAAAGITNAAFACDRADDCYQFPDQGPVLACDDDTGRDCN